MNEFELIERLKPLLTSNAATTVGAGDDCAVLDIGLPGQSVLLKTDSIVEGIHFTPDLEPERIGHKALARCLSDIAAMGGKPTAALITLALPTQFSSERIEGIYRGMAALAKRYDVGLVGGETTTNPERMLISISVLGLVEKGRAILRSGAKVGDAIFVSGELGGSLAGRHADFEPRLDEARWLLEHFKVHAMMDVSDGLAGDLRHMLTASGVGAELLSTAIPISRQARLAARSESSAKPPLLAALTDGEDFELVFTVASADAVRLKDAWRERFPKVAISCIGRIVAGHGVKLRDKTGIKTFPLHGYVHFQ